MKDILINSSEFTRLINGDTANLSEEWKGRYGSSVNSVLYFFQIPFVLNDPGAIKKYVGSFEIKGEPYLGVEVSFQEEGGGDDYEDVFLYWIHKEEKTIDYFAYSYKTEGGGIRFREAINRRNVKGLITQDYVNYTTDKNTPLEELPALYEAGKLRDVSMIINENVRIKYN